MEHTAPPRAGARDIGWIVVAVLAGAFLALSALGGVIAVVAGNWFALVQAPLSMVAGYWFSAGAWRRTVWGRPEPVHAPPDPPMLSDARARHYIAGALACVAASAIALAVQMIEARG